MRNSKSIISATIAVSAILGINAASAADLPARSYTKAAPMVAMYDWSGFYIGLNGGGGSSHKCWGITSNGGTAIVPVGDEGCHNATGGTVGGQVGYRWQSAAWVFGLEAQGNWANFRGSNLSSFFGPPVVNQSNIDGFGLFTGQVGYAWNNVLWYVKGGAAVVSDNYQGHINITNQMFDTAKEARWGGVVGTGVEFGFMTNWSFALEYEHMFMGTKNVSFTSTGFFAPAGSLSRIDAIRQDVDLVTARINYRFGGPVVAKY